MNERKKACWFCAHAVRNHYIPGTYEQPPEPQYAECDCEGVDTDLGDTLGWEEEKMPEVCGHFTPTLVHKCKNCDRVIDAPEWSHPFWATGVEEEPCCSKECQDELQEKILKYLKAEYGGE